MRSSLAFVIIAKCFCARSCVSRRCYTNEVYARKTQSSLRNNLPGHGRLRRKIIRVRCMRFISVRHSWGDSPRARIEARRTRGRRSSAVVSGLNERARTRRTLGRNLLEIINARRQSKCIRNGHTILKWILESRQGCVLDPSVVVVVVAAAQVTACSRILYRLNFARKTNKFCRVRTWITGLAQVPVSLLLPVPCKSN